MRRRTSLLVALAAAAGMGAAAVVGIAGWTSDTDTGAVTRQEYAVGERPPAPPLAGETLDRDRLDVADLRGDVVVVNIWGSWCAPCRAEMPELEEVYQDTRELGVSFVGVNILDDRDQAASFADSRVTYPSIFDPDSSYALGFTEPPAPVAPPATLVVDRDGNLAARLYRVVGAAELAEIVTGVAAEESPGGEPDG